MFLSRLTTLQSIASKTSKKYLGRFSLLTRLIKSRMMKPFWLKPSKVMMLTLSFSWQELPWATIFVNSGVFLILLCLTYSMIKNFLTKFRMESKITTEIKMRSFKFNAEWPRNSTVSLGLLSWGAQRKTLIWGFLQRPNTLCTFLWQNSN